jgi:hypothetical protein
LELQKSFPVSKKFIQTGAALYPMFKKKVKRACLRGPQIGAIHAAPVTGRGFTGDMRKIGQRAGYVCPQIPQIAQITRRMICGLRGLTGDMRKIEQRAGYVCPQTTRIAQITRRMICVLCGLAGDMRKIGQRAGYVCPQIPQITEHMMCRLHGLVGDMRKIGRRAGYVCPQIPQITRRMICVLRGLTGNMRVCERVQYVRRLRFARSVNLPYTGTRGIFNRKVEKVEEVFITYFFDFFDFAVNSFARKSAPFANYTHP